jgi:uncharacterized protein (TIGR02757 family)
LLKETLDRLYTEFNYPDSATDPIQIVRRFPSNADREVVAFVAASLAFGRVASVLQSIERVLAIMGPSPAAFVRAFDPKRDGRAFSDVVHRWTRGQDVAALIWVMRQMIDESGSIEGFFVAQAFRPAIGRRAALKGCATFDSEMAAMLESFSERAMALNLKAIYGRGFRPTRGCPGVAYFFPRPSTGSGCKRLNLFLRWMVRHDALDLGVWTRVPPSKLIVPLDTHVIRVGRCLQLTRYTSPGWRMAEDITASLRKFDPDDPVKYDFALCHIGMMNACGFNRAQADSQCPLRGACRPRARRPRRSARPSARR